MIFEGMVVHYNHAWVKKWVKAEAICFGNHVFTHAPKLSDHVLAHEYCHVAQYEVYGFWGYLIRWLYWTWKVGYSKNPFEEQARTYADAVLPRPVYDFWEGWAGLRWVDPIPLGERPVQEDLWPY